jgi:hypothetical protein
LEGSEREREGQTALCPQRTSGGVTRGLIAAKGLSLRDEKKSSLEGSQSERVGQTALCPQRTSGGVTRGPLPGKRREPFAGLKEKGPGCGSGALPKGAPIEAGLRKLGSAAQPRFLPSPDARRAPCKPEPGVRPSCKVA